MCECYPHYVKHDSLIHDVRAFPHPAPHPMALYTLVFREQGLKRPLIGLALLTYAALFSSALGHVEVWLLVWLTEEPTSSGTGNERVFVHTLSHWHAACF